MGDKIHNIGKLLCASQQSRTIRLPIHITEKLNKIKRVQRELSQKLGSNPTVIEIAEVLEVKPNQIRNYLNFARKPMSLDVRVGEEKNTELKDLLEDDSFSPEDFVLEESLNQTIKDLLSKLSPQQQEILTLRFGLEDGKELTLNQVSQRMGISRQRVLQLQRQALSLLRRYGKKFLNAFGLLMLAVTGIIMWFQIRRRNSKSKTSKTSKT